MERKQPDSWTRFAIDREAAGRRLGSFPAVLATNGEASDGDIISIEGMRVPDSMPMLFRHNSTVEIPALGRIVEPVKGMAGDKQVVRVTGSFDLEGEKGDPLLAIRKGFASMVQQGTLDAMSVRWQPVFGKFVQRSSLPVDHFAYADRSMPGPAGMGLFYEESDAQEGSIVAIGADPGALMGRARDSESAFEEAYWTVLAARMSGEEGVSQAPNNQRDLFDAMTKVIVEAVREESRESFKLMREHESDIGVSSSEVVRLKDSLTQEEDREIPVETSKTNEPAPPIVLNGASLRSLIKETAVESVSRRVDHALGRIPRNG
jgi:hypothetical protein